MTRSDEPYNNSYCHVMRLESGQMRELTEYLDTLLVERLPQAPG
jgi:ketosteroid isomerase-like protein